MSKDKLLNKSKEKGQEKAERMLHQCLICTKELTSKQSLERHLKNVHENLKLFK
jgi:hypothetical protein